MSNDESWRLRRPLFDRRTTSVAVRLSSKVLVLVLLIVEAICPGEASILFTFSFILFERRFESRQMKMQPLYETTISRLQSDEKATSVTDSDSPDSIAAHSPVDTSTM
uniref:Transmembrane protein n=1 Tax=Ascaris lumbricoides TaxID=6252 RepID=A0A9J2PWQ7_ASCLU